jgi:hypothetical protein
MIRKWQYLFAALICLLLFGSLIIFYFIPKTAGIILPYRWDHIPVGQKRSTVLQYLGRPADSLGSVKADIWKTERDNGEYILNIDYKINGDTIANSYTLDFTYKLGFFEKTYHLKSGNANR